MKTHTRIAFLLAAALPVALFASSATDSRIEDAAKNSYNYRTVLADCVSVKSNDGVVTLTGRSRTRTTRPWPRTRSGIFPASSALTTRFMVKSDIPEHSDEWIALKIRGELLVKSNVSATVHQGGC